MNDLDNILKDTYYGVKTLSMKAEDIDVSSRRVKFYLSTFDVKDSHNDVIRKGAFAKSLLEKGVDATGNRRIQHLRNHDWNQLVGKFEELYEDNIGLVAISKLGRSTKGNDMLLDYQDGLIREHSIGYKNIKGKITREKSDSFGSYKNVTELNLFEGSSVTFGSNSLTPVLDVAKSENYETIIDKIKTLTDSLDLAIKNGLGTDERQEKIELQFAQLQQLHQSLKEMKPSNVDTLDDKPTELEAEELKKKQILINLITKNGKI